LKLFITTLITVINLFSYEIIIDKSIFGSIKAPFKRINKDIVYDKKTKLFWQDTKTMLQQEFNWWDAKKYCKKLKLGGYKDWRVPKRDELLSITDRGQYNFAINEAFFNIGWGLFWANEEYVENKINGWYVDFYYGNEVWDKKTKLGYVRCVRGERNENSKPNLYKDIEVVIDDNNNLMWQDTKDNFYKELNWSKANKYCKNLNLRGVNNWRLPTIEELFTITDISKVKPAINNNFTYIISAGYWSKSEVLDNLNKAWAIYFYYGGDLKARKKYKFNVRCIRDTKPKKKTSFDKIVEYYILKELKKRRVFNKTQIKKKAILNSLLFYYGKPILKNMNEDNGAIIFNLTFEKNKKINKKIVFNIPYDKIDKFKQDFIKAKIKAVFEIDNGIFLKNILVNKYKGELIGDNHLKDLNYNRIYFTPSGKKIKF